MDAQATDNVEHTITNIVRLANDTGAKWALVQCVRWLNAQGQREAASELLCNADRILDKARGQE